MVEIGLLSSLFNSVADFVSFGASSGVRLSTEVGVVCPLAVCTQHAKVAQTTTVIVIRTMTIGTIRDVDRRVAELKRLISGAIVDQVAKQDRG